MIDARADIAALTKRLTTRTARRVTEHARRREAALARPGHRWRSAQWLWPFFAKD